MRHIWLTLLLATIVVFPGAPSVWAAQEDERLEDWQRQILRALEAADAEDPNEDDEDERESYLRGSRKDRGAAEAAEWARQRYGGQPLASVRVGDGYRVRLLLDDGRVVTVDAPE